MTTYYIQTPFPNSRSVPNVTIFKIVTDRVFDEKLNALKTQLSAKMPGLTDQSFTRAFLFDIPVANQSKLPESKHVLITHPNLSDTEFYSEITPELLGRLLDESSTYWHYVAWLVHNLKIDPTIIPYRNDSSCFPALTQPLYYNDSPAYINWFEFHGYTLASTHTVSQDQTYDLFKTASPNLLPECIVYRPRAKVTKNRIPSSILSVRDSKTNGSLRRPIPLFFMLSEILDFQQVWEDIQHIPQVYPVTEKFFNLSITNIMYPRFIPSPVTFSDEVPKFYPGPAFYAWKSAPHACEALMFNRTQNRQFMLIRQTHHARRIMECPADPVEL